jgi:streptogrisin D
VITGSKRRRTTVGVAVGLLLGSTLVAVPAVAAPSQTSSADTAVATATLATTLSTTLGDRTVGSYQDANGTLVVNVTDAAAAAAVRASGATPRVVTRSASTLAKAEANLAATAAIPGTTWGTDPVTNQVLVTADSTVTGAKLAQVEAAVAKLGDAARLERVAGALSTTIAGGDAIYGGGSRCSLGFNVNIGSTPHFVTAGHCGNLAATWTTSNGQALGARVGSSFPGNDYAIFRYVNTTIARPGAVNLYNGTTRDIASAGNPVVGQTVSRSGSTTGLRSGTVLGLNRTVNYPQGSVSGLIYTNVCAQGGDSGGSLFSGTTALGLTSGGSGNCSTGGYTYFQPVTEVLTRYGAQVY